MSMILSANIKSSMELRFSLENGHSVYLHTEGSLGKKKPLDAIDISTSKLVPVGLILDLKLASQMSHSTLVANKFVPRFLADHRH